MSCCLITSNTTLGSVSSSSLTLSRYPNPVFADVLRNLQQKASGEYLASTFNPSVLRPSGGQETDFLANLSQQHVQKMWVEATHVH